MSYNIITNNDKSNITNQTTLSVTLHKSKLLQTSSTPSSYTLSLSFNQSSQVYTDKISTNLHTFSQNNNTYQFKTALHLLSQSTLLVQATTSWFFFNSTIAQITIPLTLNNINSQRQWFYLKNEQDENIVGILISFQCNDIHKLKPIMSPSINKTEISIRYPNNNYSTHYMNTHNFHNVSVIDKPQITTEYKRKLTLNSSSNININENGNIIEHSFPGIRSNSNNNITINHNTLLNCNNVLKVSALFELLSNKRKTLSEMEEKNKLQILNNSIANDRIKDNERILNKENTKLLDRVRKSKIQQNEYETKTINLAQNVMKYEKIIQRENIVNDILNFNNEMNLHFSNIYNYSYNNINSPTKSLYLTEQQQNTKSGKTHQLSSSMLAQNKREISTISTTLQNLHIETLSNGTLKQKPPNAILDHNSLLHHNKSNKNQRQDPAKKSNSTYMTTTQNTSEVSFNDYLINKPPIVSQIYLNTSGVNNDVNTEQTNNVIKDNLDCAANKKVFRRKTTTNHSYLNYSNLMNNGVNINNVNANLIDNNYSNTIRKNSVKSKNAVKGDLITNNDNIPNNTNNPIFNRCKKRKQTVISLTSHKPLNAIYNNGQNVTELGSGTNQCSTTRKSKKHISLKKI